MNDWFKIFIPTRVLKWLGAIVGFWLKAQENKRWVITVFVFVLAFLILSSQRLGVLDIAKPFSWMKVSMIIILSSIPSMWMLSRSSEKIVSNSGAWTVGVLEFLTISDKDYFDTNFDTQRVSEGLKDIIGRLQSLVEPFKSGKVRVIIVSKPRIYYLGHSLSSLKLNLAKQAAKANVSMLLMPQKDTASGKIDFDLLLVRNFIGGDEFKRRFCSAFGIILPANVPADRYVDAVSRLFFAIAGQSVLDVILQAGDFALAHRVNDDSEKDFKRAVIDLEHLIGANLNSSFLEIKNGFACQFNRYRGLLLINQKQYLAGLKHIFVAIALNPYFPYADYMQFRDAFNRRYGAQLSAQTPEILDELDGELGETEGPEWYHEKAAELNSSIEYSNTSIFSEILKFVIRDAESDDVNTYIEEVFSSEFCAAPGKFLIIGDVAKYLPKGDLKSDAIYIERIPEVIQALEAALEMDSEFVLLDSRIGILMVTEAFSIEDESYRNQRLEEGMARHLKGSEYMHRFGLYPPDS
ncbi:hypothetical protein MKQ68_11215 [Chitinophaga horti]|uniref:Uncharacterized protein n=1 Tax=Chitinophaga horti TaxID=2920382 RepID=A0ABY6JBA9_9BACT|nr:hypothetical protein [Chitinophaga horti]UYQ95672.1 hypothetical protein MKQ68_11215 [Chitinophaga horti]